MLTPFHVLIKNEAHRYFDTLRLTKVTACSPSPPSHMSMTSIFFNCLHQTLMHDVVDLIVAEAIVSDISVQ
jgi:hypothetical protein